MYFHTKWSREKWNISALHFQFVVISFFVKVIRKLTAYDLSNDLAVHVALDNTIVIDDAKEAAANSDKKQWRPLLLVVPLRLGLTDINPIYFADLKVRFQEMVALYLVHKGQYSQ